MNNKKYQNAKYKFFQKWLSDSRLGTCLVSSNQPETIGQSFDQSNHPETLLKSPSTTTHPSPSPRWQAMRGNCMHWLHRHPKSNLLLRNNNNCNCPPKRSSPCATVPSLSRELGTALRPRWTPNKPHHNVGWSHTYSTQNRTVPALITIIHNISWVLPT